MRKTSTTVLDGSMASVATLYLLRMEEIAHTQLHRDLFFLVNTIKMIYNVT